MAGYWILDTAASGGIPFRDFCVPGISSFWFTLEEVPN
jgi:hypothetical protein